MVSLRKLIDCLASSSATALITGESGTGKELIAQALHQGSDREDGPFVPVNCGAIPDELAESVLFGHERGAFTGAVSRGLGYFETASGGTLVLDEVGEDLAKLKGKLGKDDRKLLEEHAGFVRDMETDPDDAAIVRAVLKAMGMTLRNLFREAVAKQADARSNPDRGTR